MPGSNADTVVVGAGIIGLACARELALAGLRVVLCEAGDRVAGSGATAVATGHLAVMSDSEAQFALTELGQRLWRDFASELPAEAQYLPCGSLWIAADQDEWREAEKKLCYYRQRNVEAELLDERQLQEAEPKLRRGLAGALLLPGDAVCLPVCAAQALAEAFVARGGEIRLHAPVSAVSDSGVRLADGSELSAGCVIVATGVALPALAPLCQVTPRKGHLASTMHPPGFLRHQLLELGYSKSAQAGSGDSIAFNLQPRATGEIVIGSSREYRNTDPAIGERVLQSMLQRAFAYVPELADAPVTKAWTGFRPATPDNLPLIGLSPGCQRVYVAGGHEGLGISSALATARLLADDILVHTAAIPRGPYQPARLAGAAASYS